MKLTRLFSFGKERPSIDNLITQLVAAAEWQEAKRLIDELSSIAGLRELQARLRERLITADRAGDLRTMSHLEEKLNLVKACADMGIDSAFSDLPACSQPQIGMALDRIESAPPESRTAFIQEYRALLAQDSALVQATGVIQRALRREDHDLAERLDRQLSTSGVLAHLRSRNAVERLLHANGAQEQRELILSSRADLVSDGALFHAHHRAEQQQDPMAKQAWHLISRFLMDLREKGPEDAIGGDIARKFINCWMGDRSPGARLSLLVPEITRDLVPDKLQSRIAELSGRMDGSYERELADLYQIVECLRKEGVSGAAQEFRRLAVPQIFERYIHGDRSDNLLILSDNRDALQIILDLVDGWKAVANEYQLAVESFYCELAALWRGWSAESSAGPPTLRFPAPSSRLEELLPLLDTRVSLLQTKERVTEHHIRLVYENMTTVESMIVESIVSGDRDNGLALLDKVRFVCNCRELGVEIAYQRALEAMLNELEETRRIALLAAGEGR